MEKQLSRFHKTLKAAIEKEAPKEVGTLVDFMRFRLQMDYEQCFALAHELTGISIDDWDQLLCEADALE